MEDQNNSRRRSVRPVVTAVAVSVVIVILACAAAWWVFLRPGNDADERVAYENIMRYERQNMLDSLQSALDEYFDTYNSDARYYAVLKSLSDAFTAENADWKAASALGMVEAVSRFLDMHPDGHYHAKATEMLDSLSFASAMEENTKDAFVAYIDRFPDGRFVQQAGEKMSELDNQPVSDEEIDAVGETIERHFDALAEQDKAALRQTVSHVISSYIGKTDPTLEDIFAYMEKIHQSGRVVKFDVDNEEVTKSSSGNETVYGIQFTLKEEIYSSSDPDFYDDEEELQPDEVKRFTGTAIINEAMKITSLTLRQ